MKVSTVAPHHKKLHGTALFTKNGSFEKQSLEIVKNNYAKVNLPLLTGY